VRQLGRRAVVGFIVPQPRGARPAQQPARAELLRVDYGPGPQAPPDPDAFRRRGQRAGVLLEPLRPGARVEMSDPVLGSAGASRAGWTLRYGVRVLDRRGRPSPLVVAPDLVPVEPPPPPTGLRAEATGDGVRLTWAGPALYENPRYNLYRTVPEEPFGDTPVNSATLTVAEFLDATAEAGKTYLYQVRTAASGELPYRESDPSELVEVLAEDLFAPSPPGGLVAVQEGVAVRLFWNPNDERDLAGYRIYRQRGEDPWERIGPDPILEPLYLDQAVAVGDHVRYRVTAVDRASPPNESEASEVRELDLAEEPEQDEP
jgi:hypothetical protein